MITYRTYEFIIPLENDVFDANYIISNDAFFSKFNAIISDFTYLFDVYSNGNVHTLDHIINISYWNSIHTEPFNISDTESSKKLQLAISLSFEEKSELERIIKKWKIVFTWSYDNMPRIDHEVAEHFVPTDLRIRPIK